jgi:hypothetical protein
MSQKTITTVPFVLAAKMLAAVDMPDMNLIRLQIQEKVDFLIHLCKEKEAFPGELVDFAWRKNRFLQEAALIDTIFSPLLERNAKIIVGGSKKYPQKIDITTILVCMLKIAYSPSAFMFDRFGRVDSNAASFLSPQYQALVYEIGGWLHSMGGISLMVTVADMMPKRTQKELELAWHGIGSWLA